MKLDPLEVHRQRCTALEAKGWPYLSDRAGSRNVLRHVFIPMTTLPAHGTHLGDST